MGTSRLICLMLAISLSFAHFTAFAAPTDAGEISATSGPKKHLTNIVFAGLAGAVLGLSTLSFYGRPQERLSNIAVGFAVGVIIGTAYSTYRAASEPREFYGWSPQKDAMPEQWAKEDSIRLSPQDTPVMLSNLVFSF